MRRAVRCWRPRWCWCWRWVRCGACSRLPAGWHRHRQRRRLRWTGKPRPGGARLPGVRDGLALGAEVVVAGFARAADVTEGLLDRGLIAVGGHAGELVGGDSEIAADLPGLVPVLEELGLDAGLVAQLLGGGLRAVERAHAGVGGGRDGVGGGCDL